MADLSDKFTTLETQLQTQHVALMEKLSTLSDQLAAIAVALAPPPPPAVTLADVITAIEAGNAIAVDSLAQITAVAEKVGTISDDVADIHLDTQSMDLKLLTMRNTLGDIHLDTQSIDQKLLRIRDAINPLGSELPEGSINTMPWLLYRLVDAIGPEWPRTTFPAMQPGLSALIELMALYLPDLGLVQNAIGMPTGDATTTVLGLLSSLQYSNSALVTGQQSLILCGCPPTAEGCTNPYISTGLWLAPFGVLGYESIIVATWPTPPAGITYGSYFGLGEDHTELYSDDWTGWSVFVESDQPQYSADTGTLRHPTGVWQAVPDGPGSYAFAVDHRGALKVTLCPPDVDPGDGGGGEGVGWGEKSDLLRDNESSAILRAHGSALDLDDSTMGNISPHPIYAIGDTLYWHWCGNNTQNANKALYIATDNNAEESIFLTIHEGETVPWVVTTDRFLYVWSYQRDAGTGSGITYLTYAWTPELAESHCPA